MKKHYSFILLLLAFGFIGFAKDVDVQTAEKVARHFYFQNSTRSLNEISLTLAQQVIMPANVGRTSDDRPVYYVFSINNNGGFVIVSGDDLTEPILGYSTEGNFVASEINPSTRKWFENYREQILFVKENRAETTEEINRLWDNYIHNTSNGSRGANAVNPLCATKWNQSPYENLYSPFDNQYNERTVTGCVATAMAQIMKFWNYPAQGTGFHSYNHQKYGTQSANFGNTTYQWSSMPNVLNSNNQAVSTLMYHCGVAVEMNFGPAATGGSGAYVATAASPIQACSEHSYKTYFGYDPATVQGVLRSNYNSTQWSNLLKGELDAGRPFQYAGIGQGGGHTWVCDGYDNNGFFHMNWGWAGNSDGYFSLSNLDPQSLGAGGGTGGFNNNQHAVIGIKPLNGGGGGGGGGGGTINQDGIQLYAATTVSANPFTSGGNLSVYATIANAGTTNFTGNFAAALFNSEGVFVDFIQEFTGQTAQAGYYYNVTFTKNALSLIPGMYYIGIYYQNGSNNYSLINQTTYYNPVTINVTGPFNSMQMYSNTTFSPTQPIKSQSFTVNTQIANAGGTNFSGYLAADLFDMEGNYVANIQDLSGVSLSSGYYNNFQFATNGLNVDPGTYYVAFYSSTNGQNWSLVYNNNYPNPVTVTIVAAPLSPDQYESNNSSGTAYAMPVNFSGNNATVLTTGSNMHVGNDYDYYKLNLPSGTNYAITARVHDSYNSGNGQNYTNDVQFSYMVNGGNWSDTYDDIMPGNIVVNNGGTVVFWVSNYFSGSTGTYLLDLQLQRGQSVGVNEPYVTTISAFPNPTQDVLFVDAGNLTGSYLLQICDYNGRVVKQNEGVLSDELIKTSTNGLAKGIYVLQLTTAETKATTKIIVE